MRKAKCLAVTTIFPIATIPGFEREDDLLGLKENIIIGHLIPAGTGMYRYQEVDIEIAQPEGFEPLPQMAESLPNVFSMADDEDKHAVPTVAEVWRQGRFGIAPRGSHIARQNGVDESRPRFAL